jgi:alpha-amylase
MSAVLRSLLILAAAAIAGCQASGPAIGRGGDAPGASESAAIPADAADAGWWNEQVFYEIFVRSFADSSSGPLANDGIGDLRGLIERLDYLNDGDAATTSDLGITGLWLMPVNPSPSYHGYDVTDYYGINPDYGTREDFLELVTECRRRGIRLIVDLVLNHSSSEHPFFEAALDGDARYRDWYIFVPAGETPSWRGPWNQQVWQQMRGQHYYGIFWSGMPDLNYRNPEVTAEAYRVADFWLREMKVDGFRLDAIRHLIEDGADLSDTPETLAWLSDFRKHVKRTDADALLLGEVWTSTEVVSEYLHSGALDLAFEFDLAGAFLDAARSGSKAKLAYALANVEANYPPNRFATLLSNHDQDRVMNQLQHDAAKARLAAGLLLTAPGVPFIYYGEEIGQVGEKPDEMIRNPMPWTPAENGGFSAAAEPWEPLQPGYEQRNVALQDSDPGSLLSLYRRLIRLRLSEPALLHGDFRLVETNREDVIAWERSAGSRRLLVLANLSGQPLEDYALDPAVAAVPRTDLLSGQRVAAGELPRLGPRQVQVLAPESPGAR